jgi:hypothetical protein
MADKQQSHADDTPDGRPAADGETRPESEAAAGNPATRATQNAGDEATGAGASAAGTARKAASRTAKKAAKSAPRKAAGTAQQAGGAAKTSATAKKTGTARKKAGTATKKTGGAVNQGSGESTSPPSGAAQVPPPGAWLEALREAVRQVDQPPVRLAELAVAELGPRAAAWVDWLHRTYPDATADGIARLAAGQARRHPWMPAVFQLGGPLVATAYLPVAVGLRATLVLRIAAAYGHDPADPARATELLEILGYSGGPDSGTGSGARTGPWEVAWLAFTSVTSVGLRRRSTPMRALRAVVSVSEQYDSLLRLAHRAALRYRPAPARAHG